LNRAIKMVEVILNCIPFEIYYTINARSAAKIVSFETLKEMWAPFLMVPAFRLKRTCCPHSALVPNFIVLAQG